MTTPKSAQTTTRAGRLSLVPESGLHPFDHDAPGSDEFQSITIVVPTYREAVNLPHLISRVSQFRASSGLAIDLLIVDDDSRDGSVELVAASAEPWAQIIVRTEGRGLSQAVLEGLRRARGEVLVCMDADLSHPLEALTQMLNKLHAGADFVVGSRYVDGGSTSHDWGFLRWINSRAATMLALPLTTIRDPMSGFFALRRSTFEAGRDFNPVGYKIGLELIVKCGCERVVEVPIHFDHRKYGESKLTLTQQLLYLQHLRRLYIFKWALWSQLTHFLAVGALGTAVNLGLLTILLALGLSTRLSVAVAIALSIGFNFVLNRRFSFAGAHHQPWMPQFVTYVGASSVAALINYAVTILVLGRVPGIRPQVGALAGIAVGTLFNFVAGRYLVFRMTHIRRAEPHDPE